ncbi:MAG: nickel-dependent lactate racemase [Candidatus Atribacteria bacterium]|nr:nickel-dependent lactate racemase [Candidatus Atribacteria bacterium]
MKRISIKLGEEMVKVNLPDNTEILSMIPPKLLGDPSLSIQKALVDSIGSLSLDQIIEQKLKKSPQAKAAIVISDNTRPVPYKGKTGILWPIIEKLLAKNISNDRILILVATGTHRPLSKKELREMLDPRVFDYRIPIKNHNCRDKNNLVYLDKTSRGSSVYINRDYIEADIKILTGLVETHFMAGASGGRKSICPGLIGEESVYIFHGAPMLASPKVSDLIIDDNPCHQEALEVAKKAGADYILNVTLDQDFKLTGVFAGDLEEAHKQAVKHIKKYVTIPLDKEYDIVITHAGFVGINQYQTAKAAVVAIPALKPNGKLIMIANNNDEDLIGSEKYKAVLHLLKIIGAKQFNHLILSPDWTFIPDQWQVQMWARLFSKIPPENFIYYSPRLSFNNYKIIPGVDGNMFLPRSERYKDNFKNAAQVIEKALEAAIYELKSAAQEKIRIAYLADGPYGVLLKN